VTSQPQPPPGDTSSVSQYLRPLRDIAAYALVAAPGVMLFVAVIHLIPGSVGLDFGSRVQDSFYSFVNLATIFFPLGAVLLALLVQPRHPQAKLVTVLALVEYGVAAGCGVIFGVLLGLIKIAGFSVRDAFEQLLIRAAWLAVFGVAAFATYQIWRHLFYTPRPKPQPGVYGQPRYGAPGTYPGQPGYGSPAPGQPGYGSPASGQPGYGSPASGQPGYGSPASGQPGYGSPASGQSGYSPPTPGQPGYGQPSFGQPSFGQPSFGQPSFGQPSSGQPSAGEAGRPGRPASGSGYSGAYAPAPGQVPTTYQPDRDHGTYGSPAAPADPPMTAPAESSAHSAFTEPTQPVPRQEPADATPERQSTETDGERTQIVGNDRPGYGPADQDPPRR
jgi:hypothetical protein